MRSVSRFFRIVVLVAALTAGQTRPAHSMIGAFTANPGVALAGAVLVGAGLLGPAAVGSVECLAEMIQWNRGYCSSGVTTMVLGYIFVTPMVLVLGVAFLPDSAGGSLHLAPLTVEQESGLIQRGTLTRGQLDAYQEERSELESIAQDVGRSLRSRLAKSQKAGVEVTEAQIALWSAEEWSARKNAVSREAFEAFSRVAAGVLDRSAARL